MDEEVKEKPLNGVNGHDAEEALKPEHHLQALMVKRNRFSYADKMLYRVYDKPDHFELVEANSAHEAFEKSGIKQAHKIQREMFYHYVAIDPDLIEPTEEVIEVETELPSLEERQVLLDAALLGDDSPIDEGAGFEAMSLREIWDKSMGHNETIESDLLEAVGPEEEEEPPSVLAAPGTEEPEPEEPEKELSSDEVNALLNAQET